MDKLHAKQQPDSKCSASVAEFPTTDQGGEIALVNGKIKYQREGTIKVLARTKFYDV